MIQAGWACLDVAATAVLWLVPVVTIRPSYTCDLVVLVGDDVVTADFVGWLVNIVLALLACYSFLFLQLLHVAPVEANIGGRSVGSFNLAKQKSCLIGVLMQPKRFEKARYSLGCHIVSI